MKENDLLKILKKQVFFKLAARKSSIQREMFFHNFFTRNGVSELLIPGENRIYDYYLDEKNFKKIANFYQSRIMNVAYWDKHIGNFEKIFIDVIKFSKELKDNPSEKNYKRYMSQMDKAAVYFAIPWFVDDNFLNRARDLFIKEYDLNLWEKAEKIITSQTKLTQTNLFTIEILKSIINKSFISKLPKFVEEYSWLDIFAPDDKIKITEDYFLNYANSYSLKDAKKHLKKIKDEVKNNKINFDKLIKDINNQELLQLIKVINCYVTLRTERIEYWRKSLVNFRHFFILLLKKVKKIDIRFNIHDLVYFFNNEISNFLLSGELPDYKSIKERKNSIIFFNSAGIEFIKDKKLQDKVAKILSARHITGELKGLSAMSGVAKGKVVIINGVQDIYKAKRGHVLVATMTFPEYLPAMKIAKAFITDEGGITCHAAIMAREFKKPCIIGTKIATKVIKDGDEVEVDANNGIIKIIKSANKRI